jgi:6-phosphogluconolactonase (cycloisomerase 2 family)
MIPIHRRSFLKTAAAFAAALPARGADHVLAYAGTYSNPKGPEGSKGYGKGILLFQMNASTGELTPHETFTSDANPSWLAFDPSRTHLYSANETDAYPGGSGSVTAWSIDRASGRLAAINTVSSEGAGPAHLSVHPSGRYVLVANYAGGTVAVLPVRANGSLGAATDVKHDAGKVGPIHAASAPPGSFAISGHEKPHAHMVQSDPSGRFVLAADLGLDQILIWKFDIEKGTLTPNAPASVAVPAGDGPRHFTFHKNGRWMFSLQEEASTLITFDYDATRGSLTAKQTISSLPKGFRGTNFTSEVMISEDGRFLYAANRLHDSIAWFAIGGDGTLTFAGEEWCRGDYPRYFNIDPSGNFLYTCNQRADAIAAFRVNRQTGALTFTGNYTEVGTPSILIFLT